MSKDKILREIFRKTDGHCHFCGDGIKLERYGFDDIEDISGAWEIDHVVQRKKGGPKSIDNCLPACVKCNRLRWHRKGGNLQEILCLGIVAKREIKKKSGIGKGIQKLNAGRLAGNRKRRKTI